jgi:hypothetical protein
MLSGGAAYAVSSSVVDSSGVIHGCVTKAGTYGMHLLMVGDSNHSCPRGMSGLDWNQQGAAGTSTAGPAGLDIIRVNAITPEPDVPYPPKVEAVATCPADHPYVVGGGGDAEQGAGSISESYPETTGSNPGLGAWVVGTSQPYAVVAYALCAK